MDKPSAVGVLVALTLCGALPSAPARADQHDPALDETLSFPDFTLVPPDQGGQPVTVTLPAGVATQGDVVGISFSGTVDIADDPYDHTAASDLCVIVQAPDGSKFTVGGRYALPTCLPDGPVGRVGPPGSFEYGVRPWAFQRAMQDGTYHSTHLDAFAAVADTGTWTFTFVHDHHHSIVVGLDWSDVTITLHKTDEPFQPGPGVLDLWRDLDLGFAQAGRTTLPVRSNRILNTAGGGGSPIELASIELVGDPEIQQVSGACSEGDSLAPGEPPDSCLVGFTCAPSAAGVFEADLVVTSADGQQTSSRLTCTGFDRPPLVITPSRHSFGRIDPNGTAGFDFTVSNHSGFDLYFTGQTRAPPAQFGFDPENCSYLAPGASCTLPVTFAPDGTEGSWVATLTPQFWAPTEFGAFNELAFGASGATIGARRLFVLAAPPILWPADNSLRRVHVFALTLPWHPRPECAISNVSSNEGLDADDDVEITGDLSLKLRAKHLGGREGRIYTIEVTCASGEEQHIGTAQVRVPRHPRR